MDQGDQHLHLCSLSEVGETGKEVRIENENGVQWLMLFQRDGRLTAWRNVCPHQGRSLNFAPGKFLFSDKGYLVCSHHGASFDLESGSCIEGPCKGAFLTAVAVHTDGEAVYLSR